MLKKLRIRNFQCHKQLTLTFDSKVTTIVGPNDKGKSAILRALFWLCFNRPRGKSFIHGDEETCQVELWLEDHKIVRTIGKRNIYKLDENEYKSFGSEVPSKIRTILNLGEVNWQHQHLPLFWFSLTPGQVAKELNSVVDLDCLDRLQHSVTRYVRKQKVAVEVLSETISNERKVIASTRNVVDLKRQLRRLKWEIQKNRARTHQIVSLRSLIVQWEAMHGMLRASHTMLSSGLIAVRCGKLWNSIATRSTRLEHLVQTATKCRGWTETVPKLPEWSPVRVGPLSHTIKRLVEAHREFDELDYRWKQAENELEERLGGRCPTCGGILTNQVAL